MDPVRRYRVCGRVQGVGYRAFTWRTAETLGVHGWVRNRVDGTVEVLALAPAAMLDELEERLRKGPYLSRVDRVEVTEEGPEREPSAGFMVRRDA